MKDILLENLISFGVVIRKREVRSGVPVQLKTIDDFPDEKGFHQRQVTFVYINIALVMESVLACIAS